MLDEKFLHSDITDLLIKCFYKVYNTLGYGFLEKVYENALKLEIVKLGLNVECQKPIKVLYEGSIVGDYYADMIVANLIIIELKACETLNVNHQHQLQNYLKATDMEVGLLFNFGHKPQFVRRVFSNDRNKTISA